MSKQVQIDFELFCRIVNYFFPDEEQPAEWEADEIRKGLDEKIDKIISRELFTKYKRTPTGAEREQARREYLDHKGVTRSFRSDKELRKDEI